MARFPRTKPEVMDLAILRIALAQAMVSGLTGNAVLAFSRAVQRPERR